MRAAWDMLGAAAADRRSGSVAVARAAAEAFRHLARELEGAPPEDVHLHVREAVRLLLAGQPSMAACLRLADAVLRAIEAPGARASSVGQAAAGFAERLQREARRLPRALGPFLAPRSTVLTVSCSEAVVGALAARSGRRLSVLCAASEPGGEGETAAARLRQAGVEAMVIPDAAVASAASNATVLVGADAVGPSAFLNKVGSLAAMLGAREGRRPRLVVAGTSKLCDARTWDALLEASGNRLLASPHGAPDATLEAVPLRHATAVVTEDGPLTPAAARRLAARARLHRQVEELWRS